MAGASVNISVDDSEVQAGLQALLDRVGDLGPAMRDAGEMLLLSHRTRWDRAQAPDGVAWAALHPRTVRHKKRNKDKILMLDGFLRDSLNYRESPTGLEFGTPSIYGATHQFGRCPIPPRPFLGLSDEDTAGIAEIVRAHIMMED